MSRQVWAAALLIATPLWFNTTFASEPETDEVVKVTISMDGEPVEDP